MPLLTSLIQYPTYYTNIPSTNKQISFRPFLEGERKILLMALESNDPIEIQTAVKKIVLACFGEELDTDSMPHFDLEYLFLQLRAKSIGEIINRQYLCNNEVDGKECGNIMNFDVNLLEISVEGLRKDGNKIQLTPNLWIELRYPTLMDLAGGSEEEIDIDIHKLVRDCIIKIYSAEQVYTIKDFSSKDLDDFLDRLTLLQFQKLEEFIDSTPTIRKEINVQCGKCKFEHVITIEGLQNFFL